MAVDLVLGSARQGLVQALPWYSGEHEFNATFRAVDFIQPLPTYDDRNTAGVAGVFNPNDGLPSLRLTAPAGFPPAAQSHRYYGGGFHPVFNRQPGCPYGIYYRAYAKIVDLNRDAIEFAFCGFGRPDWFDNGFNARVRPVYAFFATGTSNWFCRTEDGAGIVDQFDTGVDPSDPHLLEIVIQPGSTRFYIDGTLIYTSSLQYPVDNPTDHQTLRYAGCHIKGDGLAAVALDIAMERFHYYWLASTTDPWLSEARLNIYRPSYTLTAFFQGNNVGENPNAAGSTSGRGGTGGGAFQKLNSSEFGKGLWSDNDKFWVGRCAAPTGQGNPDDAASYFIIESNQQDVRWGLYNRFEASPIGWYFGAVVRIEDLNRSSIDLAFAGWGLRGNKATDKEPLVAFFVEGASNWKCRVQDDASSGAVTDDFITTVDPTDPHFLEIVIIAGEVRFYIDGVLIDTSSLTFPPDTAAKSDSWEREPGFYIDGDNIDPTAMRFGLFNSHTFERVTPVEF